MDNSKDYYNKQFEHKKLMLLNELESFRDDLHYYVEQGFFDNLNYKIDEMVYEINLMIIKIGRL